MLKALIFASIHGKELALMIILVFDVPKLFTLLDIVNTTDFSAHFLFDGQVWILRVQEFPGTIETALVEDFVNGLEFTLEVHYTL